jgi:hypothetical protein
LVEGDRVIGEEVSEESEGGVGKEGGVEATAITAILL